MQADPSNANTPTPVDFQCRTCALVVELRTREPGPCACGGELRRVFSPPAVAFKGKGFYRTGG